MYSDDDETPLGLMVFDALMALAPRKRPTTQDVANEIANGGGALLGAVLLERALERQRKFREAALERQRKFHEAALERQRKRYEADPENYTAYSFSRRITAEGRFTAEDIKQIRIAQKGKCTVCGIALAFAGEHRDHIVPLAKRGTNWPSNIQLLCGACNMSKGTKSQTEFGVYFAKGLEAFKCESV
jgi:5-methylcytosine-specific restriction endonuclease McrA